MRALKRVEGINVVPLIDVILTLLAIVLTISTFVATGQIKIDLPEAKNAQNTAQNRKVEIALTSDGSFYFNGVKVEKEDFKEMVSSLSKEDFVSIKADKKSAFENFVFVMDVLKTKGVEKIAITAKSDG